MDEAITEVQSHKKIEELKLIAYADEATACEDTKEDLEGHGVE